MKYLSDVANDVLRRSAEILDTNVEDLVGVFELGLKPGIDNYARRLIEFCSTKAIVKLCCSIGDKLSDGSFSNFTFDTMLAWETPSCVEELPYQESVSKEKEDRKPILKANPDQINDEVSLFYSDIMPLLVDEERNVGQEAFVWLCSVFPLAADIVNVRFTFETLTASTASKLHFPSYDRYLKEVDRCIKNLKQQSTPTGVELAEDEYIIHVDGTPTTQRVVRHVESTSWPGRLTLTNHALYFEASRAISYENALVVNLTNQNVDHKVTAASTGPWGVPLYDKAIIYESNQLSQPLVLEFPELTSSTRRDHWLALIKEVILMHDFISKLEEKSPVKSWDVQARTILGIVRLHAAREMLRIAPPTPTSFLIFSLYNEVPKGDYVLEELSKNVKNSDVMHPCSATSILKNLEILSPIILDLDAHEQKPRLNADVREEQTSQLTPKLCDQLEEKHSIEELPELFENVVERRGECKEEELPHKLVERDLKLFEEQQSNQVKGEYKKDEQFRKMAVDPQVLEEESKQVGGGEQLCKQLIVEELPQLSLDSQQIEELGEKKLENDYSQHVREAASLDSIVTRVREDAKDVLVAKNTTEGLQEGGVTKGLLILAELLTPLKELIPWVQSILTWESPSVTLSVIAVILVIIYKEWVGFFIGSLLFAAVGFMLWARKQNIRDKYKEVVVDKDGSADTSTAGSIATAQDGFNKLQALVPIANISILKIESIIVSRSPKHADHVMLIASGVATTLMAIPFKFVVMALALVPFLVIPRLLKQKSPRKRNRRLKEWWESIPVVPVRVVDDSSK